MATDAWGIDDGYHDAFGRWRDADPGLVADIRDQLGDPAQAPPPALIARAGQATPLDGGRDHELVLEDGTMLRAHGALAPDLPLGVHELRAPGGAPPRLLIVRPPACHLPDGLRAWGFAVQLHAVWSRASQGIGDLADLALLGRHARELGASLALLNPLGAPKPTRAQEPSPYYASTRLWRSPLLLRAPGVAPAPPPGGHIDRDSVWREKRGALEAEFRRAPDPPGLAAWVREQGEPLARYGVFAALSERFDAGYGGWPEELRRPYAAAVLRFAAEQPESARFHLWLQWRIDAELAAAGAAIGIVTDIPVGFAGDGFDAWLWQDLLASGMSLGAPPDGFNPDGQDWGLPPFVPGRLRAARYEPLRLTLRAALRHAAGTRLDHVMSAFRQYWIRHGTRPEQGTYVRYPFDEILAVIAIESARASAFVIGEDLGTVEPGVRERLAAERILGYRLLWFDEAPPERWPALTAGAITTHDLPTVAGLWTGSDLAELERLGLASVSKAVRGMRAEVGRRLGFGSEPSVTAASTALHRRLAAASSAIRWVTLEDLCGVEPRPNIPGTTRERPNWTLALPRPLDELPSLPAARELATWFGAQPGARRPLSP